MQAKPDIRTHSQPAAYRGLMRRLRRNQAGNVLPVMAMAIIPLAGLVGGSVDMSRMYLAKARLQQACDAGALAGRKVMGSNAWSANSNAANTAALQFFDGNFADGAYGTTGRTRAFTEAAGKVTGTASVTVPMSIMKVFGIHTKSISVECDAEMRLPNTDIMFALDITGSMKCRVDGSNCNSDSSTKIAALRIAVKCFYETVAKLDTTAVCGSPDVPPSGGTSGVQIRFGFMPYATNVNVGKLLPTSYFANDWSYQTRKRNFLGYVTTNGSWSSPSWSSFGPWGPHAVYNNVTDSEDCEDLEPNNGTTYGPESTTSTATTDSEGYTTTTTARTRLATYTEYRRSYSSSLDRCTIEKRTRTRTETRTDTTAPDFNWNYGYLSQPVGGLKNGTSWNSSLTLPIGVDSSTGRRGVDRVISWEGCIEERETVKASSYSPIPSGAKDLDIDLIPTQGDSSTLWGPALPGLIYERQRSSSGGSFNLAAITTSANYYDGTNSNSYTSIYYFCPTEAKKLQEWTTASTFTSYVDSLSPNGNTYHDIGLIWAARFMSAEGIFASENAQTPQGGEIERHLIFMTDGETCTSKYNYAAYGLPWYDRRQTDIGTVPTDCNDSDPKTLNQQVDARFSAVCTAIKNKNITLWVVYFGTTDAATTTRMTNCATPGRFYNAANAAALIATFRSIADQISQLRLTK